MTTDNLSADLDALPGVAAAEVTQHEDETPVVRVWLDGTKDGNEVRGLVDALLGRSIPSVVLPGQKPHRRRVGLGRGLGDLIPNDESIAVPTHLRPAAPRRPAITNVAVVESSSGVSVAIEDGLGVVHSVPVDVDRSIDGALLEGVLALVDRADARMEVKDVETGDGLVIIVTAVEGEERSAGAAFVEHGRLYAVASAAIVALVGN
jgi:hypothetical protein